MKKTPDTAKITAFMPGRMIDGYSSDATNMGAAMALSAFDTLSAFFLDEDPFSFDAVVTGDLGAVGSSILSELLKERHPYGEYLSSIHKDCGEIIFDRESQGVNAGGSGCGCSAATLSCHFLPLIREGKLKKILFMSTGALMNPQNTLQGDHILGIAPSIVIEHNVF
jgi:stage V sporulation protein AD